MSAATAVSAVTVAIIAKAAMPPVRNKHRVRMHPPMNPMRKQLAWCHPIPMRPTRATRKAVLTDAKVEVAVDAVAAVDAVTSAVHARTVQSNSLAQPKARKRSWDLQTPNP